MFTWRRTRDHKKKNPISSPGNISPLLTKLLFVSPLERLLAAFQLFLRSPATLLFYPSPPLPPPITTVLTLLSFQTPTNLWLYAAARTPDRVGRELRGEVAQWELCGMKQRRHPIKNQSEACASVTLQKGLWRRARSLNAGLSSELDVTWHVVFLQHFFKQKKIPLLVLLMQFLRPPTVSDVWKGAMRGQQSQPIIVSSVRFHW